MKIAAVLAAATAASPALAQDAKTFQPEGYPAAVQAVLEDARGECRREGGSAVVEFMREGPRSTGQSGHWLQSRRTSRGVIATRSTRT